MGELRRSGLTGAEGTASGDKKRGQARNRARSEDVSSKLHSSQDGANLKDRNQRGGRGRAKNSAGSESSNKPASPASEGWHEPASREVYRAGGHSSSGQVFLAPRKQQDTYQQGRQQQQQNRQKGDGGG